ncbi:MAG: GGDEF domain-containing protein [Pseudomonadota bacterium]
MEQTPNPDALRQKKPTSPHQKSWQTGREAFKFISKYRTGADPKTYAVWFDYASNGDAKLAAELDQILAKDRGVTNAEMRQLFESYLADGRNNDATLNDISTAIQSKVEGANSLVSEVISNTNQYVSSMDSVKQRMPNTSSPEEIMQALDEVIENTRTSQESARGIQVALESTRDEITQLSSRVSQIRENLMRDSLTELINRDRFEMVLGENSADAIANGYSLTVLVVCVKNIQDLCLTASIDISEFVLKSLSGIMRKVVADQGVCARLSGDELAIMLPKSAYADASKFAKQIAEELQHFKIVAKPSDKLVGYIECAFGGAAIQPGRSPAELIRIATEQANHAKFSHKTTVKFDLSNSQAA